MLPVPQSSVFQIFPGPATIGCEEHAMFHSYVMLQSPGFRALHQQLGLRQLHPNNEWGIVVDESSEGIAAT